MDALIPILLTIGFFIFQAYLGYKKEQEKAAKRNLGKPGVPQRPTIQLPKERPVAQPVREVRERVEAPIEQPYVQTYVEPTYKSTYKREKYIPTEKPADLLAEYRRLASNDEDEVIRRAKRLRNEKRSAIKRLETTLPDEAIGSRAEELLHFDLEQAIKIKAILDRPYQ